MSMRTCSQRCAGEMPVRFEVRHGSRYTRKLIAWTRGIVVLYQCRLNKPIMTHHMRFLCCGDPPGGDIDPFESIFVKEWKPATRASRNIPLSRLEPLHFSVSPGCGHRAGSPRMRGASTNEWPAISCERALWREGILPFDSGTTACTCTCFMALNAHASCCPMSSGG